MAWLRIFLLDSASGSGLSRVALMNILRDMAEMFLLRKDLKQKERAPGKIVKIERVKECA